MNFKDGQPIYIQIAERLCDEVLAKNYLPESRIPGVREYSSLLEVNVNTTVKAYDLLAQRGIVYVRRGMGYFVAQGAPQLILESRRVYFREHAMPDFFGQMLQLGITADEVLEAWRKFQAEKK